MQGLIILGLIMGMRLMSEPTANVSYLLLAGFALYGRTQAIQAMAMCWLFTMFNPGIAPIASMGSVGRYAVFAMAAISVMLHSGILFTGCRYIYRPIIATILLGGFLVAHSLLISPILDVSILKATFWVVVVTTLMSAWLGLTEQERQKLTKQIISGLVLLMLVSLPLLIMPVGYLRNGTGFQGVLNHPQVFGPTMALLGAWATSEMFTKARLSWKLMSLVVSCLILVVLSEARTAGLALVLGVTVSFISVAFLSGRTVRSLLPSLYSKPMYFVMLIILAGVIVAAPRLLEIGGNYLSKRTDAVNLAVAYELSRGRLIENMLFNINQQPYFGIGFGIASDASEMVVEHDSLLGLPIGAPVEKGVLPLAVIEEIGIVGFVMVALWVWMILRRSAHGGVTPLAVSSTALLLNMGEATLFSPGGFGLILLVMMTWAMASGATGKH